MSRLVFGLAEQIQLWGLGLCLVAVPGSSNTLSALFGYVLNVDMRNA